MMNKREHADWWMSQLQEQLYDFLENPSGGSERGMLELMKQYKEAVQDKRIEPPRFGRSSVAGRSSTAGRH